MKGGISLICWNCGQGYAEDVNFCEKCGAYLGDENTSNRMKTYEAVFVEETEKLLGRYEEGYIDTKSISKKKKSVNLRAKKNKTEACISANSSGFNFVN